MTKLKPRKKRRREPEIVEFCEPGLSGAPAAHSSRSGKKPKKACRADFAAFMSGALTKIKGNTYKGKSVEEKTKMEERIMRNNLWKSVSAIGAMKMRGKEKWKWEQEKLKELGSYGAKNRKTPLNILIGMNRKAKWRKEKRDKEIRESGVVVAHEKKNNKGRKKGGGQKNQSFEHHYSLHGGHFGGGVLRFNKDPTKRKR